jgi:hypothetical protein
MSGSSLSLIDQAFLIAMHELDRILDRDHMIRAGLVDVVDHRRQRGRLSGASRPGHDHQPLGEIAESENLGRQAELVRGQDLGWNHPKDPARAVTIAE